MISSVLAVMIAAAVVCTSRASETAAAAAERRITSSAVASKPEARGTASDPDSRRGLARFRLGPRPEGGEDMRFMGEEDSSSG